MKQYFILVKGKSEGPFTLEELKEQKLVRDTLVWHEGLESWQKIGQLPELAGMVPPGAPKPDYTSGWIRGSFLLMALMIAALGAGMAWTYYEKSRTRAAKSAREQALTEQQEYNKAYTREHINELVYATNSSYRVRFVGGISGLKVTVFNSSDYAVDAVMVEIKYFLGGGGVFKTEILSFSNLKPHSQQAQYAPDSRKGRKIECTVSSVRCHEIGL